MEPPTKVVKIEEDNYTELEEEMLNYSNGKGLKLSRIKDEPLDDDNVGWATYDIEDGEVLEGLPKTVLNKSQHQHTVYRDIVTSSLKAAEFNEDFKRKRKVALLLSYCGLNYHGMQKNPGVQTIEKKLLEALCAINAIRPEHKQEFLENNNNQMSFQRAARTDKGVSAARQTVSLKVVASDTFLKDVNEHLPMDIRCYGIERVTKTFDAKCSCSGRSYEYLVPSFAFASSKEILSSSFRLSDKEFERANRLFSYYEGTHNFHNFTSGRHFMDKSATRYITSFKASKPFECKKHEFVAIEITGQSFMIHQIRKMIGLVIAICRNHCSEDAIEKSWTSDKRDIPKAPGLGLLLCRVFYKRYNSKHCQDGLHTPITWSKEDLEVERFKIEKIWQSIIDEEIKKSSLLSWLKTLANHTYSSAGMKAPQQAECKGVHSNE